MAAIHKVCRVAVLPLGLAALSTAGVGLIGRAQAFELGRSLEERDSPYRVVAPRSPGESSIPASVGGRWGSIRFIAQHERPSVLLADAVDGNTVQAVTGESLAAASAQPGVNAEPSIDTGPGFVAEAAPEPSAAAVPAPSAALLAPVGDQYIVQSGDVLTVSVWKETDLQREVLVRPDGGISFPLAGDVPAAGHSVQQIEQQLTARISKYIPEPVVTVAVQQVIGNRVYVVGRVNKPGEIIMTHDLDVIQALSLAGGVTPFASINNIRVLRRSGEQQTTIPFRYGDMKKGVNLQQNIALQNGDVVVVP